MNGATSFSFSVSFPGGRLFLAACIGLMFTCPMQSAGGQELPRVGTLDVGGTAETNEPSFIAFSADSKYIAVGDYQSNVHVFTTAGKKISVCQQQATLPGVGAIYFTAGGLVVTYGDTIASAFDLRTGRKLGTLEISEQAIYETSLSPDGRTLAVTDRQTKLTGGQETCVLKMVDLKTRETLRGAALNDQGPCLVAFNPDGRSVAVVLNNRSVAFLDATTLKDTKTIQAGAHIGALGYSPDGKSLILACDQGKHQLWHLDKDARHLRENKIEIETVAFSPTGKFFAVAGGGMGRAHLALCDPETGLVLKQLTSGHPHLVHAVAFSPNGKLMATGSRNSTTVHLWDVSALGKNLAASQEGEPGAVESGPARQDSEMRTWTSADRRFTVRAKLLERDDKNARLEKEGGGEITVPLEMLSRLDRAYLRSRRAKEK